MTLEDRLGYTFADASLLKLALTHRSVSADDSSRKDNERLEFLGDAVLQLAVTAYLYDTFPGLHEGSLAKIRAGLVSRPVLADVARSIGLAEHIEVTQAEERTGGREKESIAAFLDAGLGPAADLVLRLWGSRIDERAQRPGLKDYKTRLQEVLAKDGRLPLYHSEGSGPDHERTFVATVEVDGLQLGSGSGRSKKEAEQGAAEQALSALIASSG
jgi:ribonuclease-3